MSKESAVPAAAAAPIRVWDLVVRIGHWTMVIAFAVAYVRYRKFPLHAIAGYLILAIVLWRIVWGFIGGRYARFVAFLYSPRETVEYTLAALRGGEAREYTSHNPMGALMVFAMLPTLIACCLSGIMLYSAQQLSGPLGEAVPTAWEHVLQDIHAGLVTALLAMIAGHLCGVVWASWWHRENYVWAMITGHKPPHQRRARRAGAEHRQPPGGDLNPTSAGSPERTGRDRP